MGFETTTDLGSYTVLYTSETDLQYLQLKLLSLISFSPTLQPACQSLVINFEDELLYSGCNNSES